MCTHTAFSLIGSQYLPAVLDPIFQLCCPCFLLHDAENPSVCFSFSPHYTAMLIVQLLSITS